MDMTNAPQRVERFLTAMYFQQIIPSVLEDECATAAEIYQCGLKEDAAVVNGLIVKNKGTTTVRNRNLKKYY